MSADEWLFISLLNVILIPFYFLGRTVKNGSGSGGSTMIRFMNTQNSHFFLRVCARFTVRIQGTKVVNF